MDDSATVMVADWLVAILGHDGRKLGVADMRRHQSPRMGNDA
jgi:hypothetical protein